MVTEWLGSNNLLSKERLKLKKIYKFLCLTGVLLLASCDMQGEDISTDIPSLITEEILEDENSKYIEQIKNIELVRESSRNNYGLFENKYTFITNEYNVHLVFNESVESMNDIEIQELIEDLPFADSHSELYGRKSGLFVDKSYFYMVSEIHIQHGEDEYLVSSNKIVKNESDYDPKYEYEREQQEIERNKRYDVSLKVLSRKYVLKNVTKSEISNFYTEKYFEILRAASSTVGASKNPEPRYINWHEDVEFIKEYE